MRVQLRSIVVAGALLLPAACSTPSRPPAPAPAPVTRAVGGELPPIPRRDGALEVEVVYPGEGAQIAAVDSTFVFGNVGTGGATLAINGTRVPVAPNGAFLAFLPVPADGVYQFEAQADGQTAALRRQVRVAAGAATGAAVLEPRGVMALPAGERVTVRVRGPRGAAATLLLPDGTRVPLAETTATERPEGFMLERIAPREVTEYTGSFAVRTPLLARGREVGVPTLATPRGAGAATVELVAGGDTTRLPVGLSLGVLEPGATRTAVAASTRLDEAVIGRAIAGGGTPYHWSFPNGARFTVTGERDGLLRVRLTADHHVWVDARDVRLLPAGTPPANGTVGTVRLDPQPEWVDVRLAVSERLPARVEVQGDELRVAVYGAASRTNWLQYGRQDPYVRAAEWSQERDGLYVLRLELARPAWGWRTFYDERGNLVVRVRRPPAVDAARPLQGMYVGVDAGHPPGGATGPTGLTEAEANQAIAQRLVRMLRAAGARVLETRPDTAAVELAPRTEAATDAGVHLLVSVHNNAFPDGVNPWENNGTTVFYNQPPSRELARLFQRELVQELGLRDLGIARADLALVRPTWMPSALTESTFMMIPQQEAALRDPGVQERIARAHFRAIEAFFRMHAAPEGER